MLRYHFLLGRCYFLFAVCVFVTSCSDQKGNATLEKPGKNMEQLFIGPIYVSIYIHAKGLLVMAFVEMLSGRASQSKAGKPLVP